MAAPRVSLQWSDADQPPTPVPWETRSAWEWKSVTPRTDGPPLAPVLRVWLQIPRELAPSGAARGAKVTEPKGHSPLPSAPGFRILRADLDAPLAMIPLGGAGGALVLSL